MTDLPELFRIMLLTIGFVFSVCVGFGLGLFVIAKLFDTLD